MSDGSDPIDDVAVEDRRLCSGCINDDYLHLKDTVEKSGEMALCTYCKRQGKTTSIGNLADEIGGAFERHYCRTPMEPSSFEYTMSKESDYEWCRTGLQAVYAIAEAAGIDEDAAEDVRQVLQDRNGDFDKDAAGEEGEFDVDSHYEEKDADATDMHYEWLRFQKILKTESRLFNASAEAILSSIFDGVEGLTTRYGKTVIVNAGPKRKISSLYRARVFQSDEKLEEALKRPDLELGPPPLALATAGRMNSRGIAVFYGATDPGVALAETRPPVGSRVLVGRFEIIRPLRLLDVEALRLIYVGGSIFDSNHIEHLKKAKFLASLSEQITKPVMPDDEPFEYLVTQGIADYLATRNEPKIDGIIYRSVQHGEKKQNVVLFYKSARVEALDIPAGSEISAHLYEHSDEGVQPDYWVFEEIPDEKQKEDDTGLFDFSDLYLHSSHQPSDYDDREATLHLDVESVVVHHVDRVKFTTIDFPIRRHRSKKSDKSEF